MTEERAAKLKAMVAARAWDKGGSDMARLIFEVLDDRADLLAALEEITEAYVGEDRLVYTHAANVQRVRAAIAKAKGES